jgi:GT2 family glycosyltransferase
MSVIGPKLLYADRTLQHAGLFFYALPNGQWQNMHYWKGYGARFEPANFEREVPAVTGACMIVRRQDFLAVGGFTEDYIVGDYEDSDLCLKLRASGGLCLYMPSIELHHFERQSMPKPSSEEMDRGSTIYNRTLHTARWSATIAALQARSGLAPDA